MGAVTCKYMSSNMCETKQVLPYCVIHQSVRTINKDCERGRGENERERLVIDIKEV